MIDRWVRGRWAACLSHDERLEWCSTGAGQAGSRPTMICRALRPPLIFRSDPPMNERELIHDWNDAGERWQKPPFRVQLDDETLRDGLQSPSVESPAIDEKIAILHLMDRLGIDTADIGLPGAGPTWSRTCGGWRRRSRRAAHGSAPTARRARSSTTSRR